MRRFRQYTLDLRYPQTLEALLEALDKIVWPYFRRLKRSQEDWAPGVPEHIWEEQREVIRHLAEISDLPHLPLPSSEMVTCRRWELGLTYADYVIEWFRIQHLGQMDQELFEADKGYDPSPYADWYPSTALQWAHSACYLAWHFVFVSELSEAAKTSYPAHLPPLGFLVKVDR